jgi:hypothetical protein
VKGSGKGGVEHRGLQVAVQTDWSVGIDPE